MVDPHLARERAEAKPCEADVLAPAEFFAQIDRLADAVIVADDPYEAGIALASFSMPAVGGPCSTHARGLWLMWGSLTDGVDGAEADTMQARARSSMRRAATEWKSLDYRGDGIEQYLDRWVYEECGYVRPRAEEKARKG